MKVQPIIQQQNNKEFNNQPKFKGAVDESLRWFATNQAIGANAVDFCFMVTPRTASDTVKRGPNAGMETFRREIMGTVNDSAVGLYGASAGAIAAYALSKKFDTEVNKIFTAPETLNILAENKAEQLKNNKTQADYIKRTLEGVKAYNPTSKTADKDGYVRLSESTINDVSAYYDELLNKKANFSEWVKRGSDKSRAAIINRMIEDTGAETTYVLESADRKIVSKTNLKSLLNDLFIVSDSFNNKKVNEAFLEQIKNKQEISENAFVKGLTKFMKTRAVAGFAMASAVGLSVQPINMYLTKLKTGSDGFVGVEGRSKDNSAGFLGIKALSSVAFFSMILSTLNIKPWKFTPAKFMDKMSFNGKMPTINQLKGIYGVTIISRIFSARDKDELREVLTKDTLGYLSWLVLGDIVNRFTAAMIDNSVVNFKKGTENKGKFTKMFNASLKTRDEILIETLAQNGIKSTKEEGEKVVAKTFKEMQKELDKLSPVTKKIAKKRLRTLNAAQISGYLFSGLVLGLGIPNLNIYITNYLDKKRKAEAVNKKAS